MNRLMETFNLTQFDKAYLAGFLDADGHITIGKRHRKDALPHHWLKVGIAQANEEFLLKLQSKVGLGNIYLNTKRKSSHHKDLYEWSITGRKAILFLGEIIDFLILKRSQAEIALEFGETIGNQGVETDITVYQKREEYRQRIRALNNQGKKENSNALELYRQNDLNKLRHWQGEKSHPYLA